MSSVVIRVACRLLAFLSVLHVLGGVATARTIEIIEPVEVHHVRVLAGQPVTIAFKSPMMEWWYPEEWQPWVNVKPDSVTLTVPRGTELKGMLGRLLVFARHYTVHLVVDSTTSKTGYDDAIVVNHKALSDVIEATVQARVSVEVEKLKEKQREELAKNDERHTAEIAELKKTIEKLERDARRRAEQEVVRILHESHTGSRRRNDQCVGQSVSLCWQLWKKLGEERGLLRFAAHNRTQSAVVVDRVAAFNDVELVDHAGAVFIEGQNNRRIGGGPMTIPPLTRVEGSVMVHNRNSIGSRIKLMLIGSPVGVLPASAWGRDHRPPPILELMLGLKGLLGFIWVGDGLGGSQLDATGLRGLGVRAQYEITENGHLMLEAEVVGAISDEARFDGVSVDDRQGDLVRTATLGRVLLGALLGLKKPDDEDGRRRLFPYVRLGVGLQGARYASKFTVSGVAAEGPGSSFDVDGLWYFGVGVDVRWGESFVAGLAASLDNLINSDSRSLQAGIHLGYAWYP